MLATGHSHTQKAPTPLGTVEYLGYRQHIRAMIQGSVLSTFTNRAVSILPIPKWICPAMG